MFLTNPACSVCGRAVDLGEILARESSSTVSSPSAISVDNDLATSQTSVTLGPTNNEAAGRLDLWSN